MFREKKSSLLKIWNVINSILLLLPFIYIGSVVLYTILNQNAFESYNSLAGTLDNAFIFATNTFIDIGFNKIDFVSFIGDIFIVDSALNNVYLSFINCYFNYMLFTLFVSFIPFVFWWFYYLITNVLNRYIERN